MEILGMGVAQWLSRMAGGTKLQGSYFLADAMTDGDFEYLVVNADCVFTTLETHSGKDLLLAKNNPPGAGGLNLAGITVSKGMVIYAPIVNGKVDVIERITLSSGSIAGYS